MSHDDIFKWFTRIASIVGSLIVVPIILASIYFVATSLKQHGEALAVINTSIVDLKKSQDEMRASLDSQLGTVIITQNDDGRKIASLEQQEIDNSGRIEELSRMSLPSPEFRHYYNTPATAEPPNPLVPLFKQLEKGLSIRHKAGHHG